MPETGRILFVTEKFPHPVDDGGQIRTWNVLRRLAAELPVTLLSLGSPSPDDEQAVRSCGAEVVVCGPRRARSAVPYFAAEALFTRAPYPMRKNRSKALLGEIRSRIASGGIRAVHFNHLDAAQYALDLGPLRTRVRAVFDTHNLLTRMYERFAQTSANPLRRAYATIQWWKMSRCEPRILRGVDRVLVCSDLEREMVHTWGVNGAMVVPNGVEVARFASQHRERKRASDPPVVVFTGALDYSPNADGVRWFLEQVLPKLRALVPAVRVVIVGKGAPRALLEHARPGAVEFTGRVEDVRPHLAAADVAIVPLFVGGGTRLKILEAMAAGVPVVSTRVGAEGIAAKEGESIVLADEPDAMARAVAALCARGGDAQRIAARGRELVAQRYDWDQVLRPLLDFYAHGA